MGPRADLLGEIEENCIWFPGLGPIEYEVAVSITPHSRSGPL